MLHRIVFIAAVVCAPLAGGQEATKVPNPEYQRWSSFKPGSSVKLLQVSDADGARSGLVLTHTLVELTPHKAVVETRSLVTGAGAQAPLEPSRTEHPVVIDDPHGPVIDPEGITIPPPRVGAEDLVIGGKTYKCRTEQFAYRIDRDAIENKLWITPEVPGGVVKSVSSVKGPTPGTTTMTVVEFDARK